MTKPSDMKNPVSAVKAAFSRVFFCFGREKRHELCLHEPKNLRRFKRGRLASCNKYKVITFCGRAGQVVVEKAESLAYHTACAVARNSVPYFFARNDSAAVPAPFIFPEIADESIIDAGFSFIIKEAEFTVFFYDKKPFGIFSHNISMLRIFCPLRVFLREPYGR